MSVGRGMGCLPREKYNRTFPVHVPRPFLITLLVQFSVTPILYFFSPPQQYYMYDLCGMIIVATAVRRCSGGYAVTC